MSETGHIDIDLLQKASRNSESPRGVRPVVQALLADCLDPCLWATKDGIGLLVVFHVAGLPAHGAKAVMEYDAAGGVFGFEIGSPYLVVVECMSRFATLTEAVELLEARAALGQFTMRMTHRLPAETVIPVIGRIYVPRTAQAKVQAMARSIPKPTRLLQIEVCSY